MGYLDDRKSTSAANHPADDRLQRKFGFASKPQKPDELADYRDRRVNRPDGRGSL